MVPMHDGVKLATDVYLPKPDGGPWPVIVARTPYGRVGGPVDATLQQGYAVVIQEQRGTGKSEGKRFVFRSDGWCEGLTDGADAYAWVRAQPWCNGKIGTWGGSAVGIVQLLAAPISHDLSAQFIEVASPNLYKDMFYQGGVFRKEMLEGWLTATGQADLIPVYKSHPRNDEFWKAYDVNARSGDITAPAMFVGGWYDIFCQGTIDAFQSREQNGGPGAKGQNYLIMKWCSHGPDVTKDYKFNENRFDLKIQELCFRMYARYLKGDADAMKDVAKVHYYVMGADTQGAPGNEWRTAETWPPFPTEASPYYLHAEGSLSTAAAADDKASLEFTFDPKNPVPTNGGANLVIPAGPFDQRSTVANRKDALPFCTSPLEAPLEITGRIKARLFVSSDAPDTDFTAKLVDIYPSGDDRQILMVDGVRRVKTRLGFETAAPALKGPDDVVELEIDLQSISWIFAKGHRIGLYVSSSNAPRFEVNPNTGAEFPAADGEMRVARNAVRMDKTHPSQVILPVRPAVH